MNKMYLIFGNPVNHSKSPFLYNKVFKEKNINSCYSKYLLEDGEDIINKFKDLNIDGASVTVPHKEWAYKLVDEVRGIAKDMKAVNCLVREGDKVIGYNTDALGFMESIKDLEYKNILIIGAGGTAKALSMVMEADILNRSAKRLQDFNNKNKYTWDNFEIKQYDLIINTTSAGLNDDNLPAPREILEKLFENAKYAVDVIYKQTPFLKMAKEYNLITRDGSGMLVYQAVLQFEKFGYKVDENIARLMFEAINL